MKARDDQRLRTTRARSKSGMAATASRVEALEAWKQIALALASSDDNADRKLATDVMWFVSEMPSVRVVGQERVHAHTEVRTSPEHRGRSTGVREAEGPQLDRG